MTQENHADLPAGTYVKVTEQGPDGRTYIGRIVGTDLGRTKYEIGVRYACWGRWEFARGGSWAFPSEVEAITAEQAHDPNTGREG